MNHRYRYIARFLIECQTPLAVGSDAVHLEQDNPVQRDFNGLPIIPATGITGFLRSKLPDSKMFGDDASKREKEHESEPSKGSNVIISDAYLFDGAQVYQTLNKNGLDEDFAHHYHNLPIRPHVAIDHRGSAKDGNLFDQEVVYKGSRFKFEIRLELADQNDKAWTNILNVFFRNDFYLGSGQYNGLGEMKVVECLERKYDLTADLDEYLDTSVNLNNPVNGVKIYKPSEKLNGLRQESYTISAINSFIHVGSGFGDLETDDTSYKEEYLTWSGNVPQWKEAIVIPGTSIKGALAHRTAFYLNKSNGHTIDSVIDSALQQMVDQKIKDYELDNFVLAESLEDLESQEKELQHILTEIENSEMEFDLFKPYVSRENEALAEIFGKPKQGLEDNGLSGKIMIRDTYITDYQELLFMHNKIDRFTGGTMDTALFSEKVFTFQQAEFVIKGQGNILENNGFQQALEDMLKGNLPIGGKVNKGHGIISGKINSNGATK